VFDPIARGDHRAFSLLEEDPEQGTAFDIMSAAGIGQPHAVIGGSPKESRSEK
jgi:hypothetical protein